MSTVLSYDPFKVFESLANPGWADSVSYGAYHQHAKEDHILIEIPLVGMTRENITVDVVDNVLTVTAKTDGTSRYSRNFKQSWNLTKDSDTDNIKAKLENGLLILTIPRIKPAKKVITVDVV